MFFTQDSFRNLRIHALIACAAICFFPSHLCSVAVDLQKADGESTIVLFSDHPDQDTLEIQHFQRNMMYLLQLQGEVNVTLEDDRVPVTIADNNTILIENTDQLSVDDTLLLTITPRSSALMREETLPFVKMCVSTDQYPNLGNEYWGAFIDVARNWSQPATATEMLGQLTLNCPPKRILSVGCESGKDPLYWVSQGADVTVLDGTPHAVGITCLRLIDKGAFRQLKGALACQVESIPETLGTFDAVVGSAVFPFIPPNQFEDVLSNRILAHVAPNGYFAGHFFGHQHHWTYHDDMTFVTVDEIAALLAKNGFEVIWLHEDINMGLTVFNGTIAWHEIVVIAKKTGL